MDKVDVDQNTPLCYNAVSCVVKVVPLQIYELKEEEESWCFVLTRATHGFNNNMTCWILNFHDLIYEVEESSTFPIDTLRQCGVPTSKPNHYDGKVA